MSDEICLAKSDASGNLWVQINASFSVTGGTFDLTIALYDGAALEGSRDIPKNLTFDESGFLYGGKVRSVTSNYYKISGLVENTFYLIGASNLTVVFGLDVYATPFNSPIECSSSNAGLNDESCVARSDASGNLWVQIAASSTLSGGTFDLTIDSHGGVALGG